VTAANGSGDGCTRESFLENARPRTDITRMPRRHACRDRELPQAAHQPSTAQRTARLMVMGFELADHTVLSSRAARTSSGFSSA
jgi:hypothetical protein